MLATLGLAALLRSSQRVYLQDGHYLVSVRWGQRYDLREFVQPDNPDVVAIYSQIGPDVWGCLDFVCSNIDYRRDIGEHWQFPSETLSSGQGDCEDSSILLTSILNSFTNGYVAIGTYQGYGHSWATLDSEILETTYTSARPVPDPEDYCPYVFFNDQEVIELWPGALGEMFSIRRNEAIKLNLMTGVIGNEVPPECPSCLPLLVFGTVMGGILGTGFAMILQKGE